MRSNLDRGHSWPARKVADDSCALMLEGVDCPEEDELAGAGMCDEPVSRGPQLAAPFWWAAFRLHSNPLQLIWRGSSTGAETVAPVPVMSKVALGDAFALLRHAPTAICATEAGFLVHSDSSLRNLNLPQFSSASRAQPTGHRPLRQNLLWRLDKFLKLQSMLYPTISLQFSQYWRCCASDKDGVIFLQSPDEIVACQAGQQQQLWATGSVKPSHLPGMSIPVTWCKWGHDLLRTDGSQDYECDICRKHQQSTPCMSRRSLAAVATLTFACPVSERVCALNARANTPTDRSSSWSLCKAYIACQLAAPWPFTNTHFTDLLPLRRFPSSYQRSLKDCKMPLPQT